jgi:ammonium transporter, Amt family
MGFSIAALSFWAFGFAIMFGGSGYLGLEEGNPLVGLSGFFLVNEAYDVNTILLWIFQMVFAATAATIVAGAMAERTKIQTYLAYSFILGALIYPLAHWVWSGVGWLGNLNLGANGVDAADFAGSGVVHAVGGLVALAGAAVVGPRLGKFNLDGTPNQLPGHSVPFAIIGTFILFFGWFGFNAGSTLAATDLRISVIPTNTLLAGAAGSVIAMYYSLARTGKADILMACNGCLGRSGRHYGWLRLCSALGGSNYWRYRHWGNDGLGQFCGAGPESGRPGGCGVGAWGCRAMGLAGSGHFC